MYNNVYEDYYDNDVGIYTAHINLTNGLFHPCPGTRSLVHRIYYIMYTHYNVVEIYDAYII